MLPGKYYTDEKDQAIHNEITNALKRRISVCMNESPIQLIKEIRISIELKRGSLRKVGDEYESCGVAKVLIDNGPLAGKRYVLVTGRREKPD